MPAQEKLSPTEQLLAYVIGGGITLAVIALFLFGLNVIDRDYTLSFLLIGLVLIVIGIGAWLYLLKPWEKFDDLKTPHYNGPAEHAAEHPAPVAEAAPVAVEPEPAAETVAEVEVRAAEEAVPEPAAEAVAEVEVRAAEEAVPEPVAEAVAAGPDDLTIIEGLGPKSAQALIDSGISTFAQIAEMTPDALNALVKAKKVRLVGSTETWPQQARLAAAGDMAGLEELKKRLRGGQLREE